MSRGFCDKCGILGFHNKFRSSSGARVFLCKRCTESYKFELIMTPALVSTIDDFINSRKAKNNGVS